MSGKQRQLPHKLPTLIRILQRIVEAVSVTVEVLCICRILNQWIGTHEASGDRIVEAGVGVIDTQACDYFVPRIAVAADDLGVEGRRCPAIKVNPIIPRAS